jgi:hypothetical protein
VYKENSPIILTWTAKADGKNGVTTSTKIDFTFSGAVTGLTAEDIIISTTDGSIITVLKGVLTGGGTAWSLEITVAEPGSITVVVGNTSVDSESQTIAVHKAGLKGGSSNDDEDDPDYDESQDGPLGVKLNSIVLSGDGLSNGKLSLPIEGYVTLTATIDPAGTGAPVAWGSNKPSVATVTDNHDGTATVTAKGGGQAVIRATTWGKSAECTVTVAYGAGLYQAGGAQFVEDNSFEDGFTLAKAFAWISGNGQNDGEYVIALGASEEPDSEGVHKITGTYNMGTRESSSASSTGAKTNVKITLRGAGDNIVIEKTNAGALFQIYGNTASDQPELVLENITLKGYSVNNTALVVVGNAASNKGSLTMKAGSRITENISNNSCGGVLVAAGGTFYMEDGSKIDYNGQKYNANILGGGVSVAGIFEMRGGSIEYNTMESTGIMNGVGVIVSGTFTMSGGTIQYNEGKGTGNSTGGGVYLNSGVFTMSGSAVIRNNKAKRTGGINMNGGTFKMEGGSIEGNISTVYTQGYGVAVDAYTFTFIKTGGVIYGLDAGDGKANKGAEGVTGLHAIQANTNFYDETAGPEIHLSTVNEPEGYSDISFTTWNK